MSNWKVIQPVVATNYCINPSAEAALNFNDVDSPTSLGRSTDKARWGDYSYKLISIANSGLSITTVALANAIHYVTFYVHGTVTVGSLSVSLDAGVNHFGNVAAIIGGSTGGWVRYGVAISAAQSNGGTGVRIYVSNINTLYFDGIQVEQSAYWTTYIDGNRGESVIYGENTGNLYYWNGHRHASSSTRDAQERGGGRVMDLEDDYGLKVQQTPGAGMPPVTHNLQGLALQPGAAFQNTKVLPRRLQLISETHSTTFTGYHSERKALINLMKPDGVRGSQPFLLGYAGANSGRTVWCRFRYEDGLGIGRIDGGSNFLENSIPLTLLAVSPYWFEDNRETAVLSFVNTLTAVNGVLARVNGLWQKLGTGFSSGSNTCWSSAYDPTTGRTYYGGDFLLANGVTVNRICYWNPATATFVAMDGGVGSGGVTAIAIAPNGDVWIGGGFTAVGTGAAAAVGLAMWDLSASAWVVPTATATSFVQIWALAIDSTGTLYGGGEFLNYSGNANCDNIFKYTTAGAFAALGTGMTGGIVYGLAVWIDGTTVYCAGSFTAGNGVTLNYSGYWNGTTFVAIGGGLDVTSRCIAIARNGNVYYGGNFTTSITPAVSMSRLGMWNGTGWERLSNGANAIVYTMYIAPDGLLYVAGNYTVIGPFTTGSPAVWNGSSWQLLDVDNPSVPDIYTFTGTPNGDLSFGGAIGNDTVIVGSPVSNIVSTNTVAVYPNFTIVGATSTNITLQEITNASSSQTMRFNLVINIGERILISLQPGAKRVASDWRGVLPGQPLPTSDFANFILQPTRADGAATNTLVLFVTGTTTGAIFLAHWQVHHWAADGAAA